MKYKKELVASQPQYHNQNDKPYLHLYVVKMSSNALMMSNYNYPQEDFVVWWFSGKWLSKSAH